MVIIIITTIQNFINGQKQNKKIMDILNNSFGNIVKLFRSYMYDSHKICIYDIRTEKDLSYLKKHQISDNAIKTALKDNLFIFFIDTKNKNILSTITEKEFLHEVEKKSNELKAFILKYPDKISCQQFLKNE